MRRNPVILQISDLHFGRSVKPREFWRPANDKEALNALQGLLLASAPLPDFIVVTGDLASGGKVRQMRDARNYLNSLLRDLWGRGHAARCIVIPGNHDVWRTTSARLPGYAPHRDRLREWNAVFKGWSFLASEAPADAVTHVVPMRLTSFYLSGAAGDRQAKDPQEAELLAARAQEVCEYFPDFGVAFLKLDSNVRTRQWLPGHIARGRVGPQQRHHVDIVLQDYFRATREDSRPFEDARIIALVHHHVTRLPNVKLENWMLMDDAGEVARWLGRRGARIVLHGHFHKADVIGLTYWDSAADNARTELIVLSAGSATARDTGDGHHSCHHIELGAFRTKVKRPLLDHGEYQELGAATSFEFVHKPKLLAADEAVPVYPSALADSLIEGEKYADQRHSYESIEMVGYIDANRSYWGTVRMTGTNRTAQDTHGIRFVFVGVGAKQFEECDCQAWDMKNDRELPKPRLVDKHAVHVFPSEILFNQPLSGNKEFDIKVLFRLDAVMLDERDYDMLNLLRFPRGVGKITMRLLCDRKILGPMLLELRGERLVRSSAEVRTVERAVEHPKDKGSANGCEVFLTTPSAPCYLLFYQRLGEVAG